MGGPGPRARVSRGHTSDQARAVEAMVQVSGSQGCQDLAKRPCWDSGPIDADQPRRQEVTQLQSKRPPSAPLLSLHLPQWPGAHGVKSLPVSLCSKLFSKRGRECFSCYQHGFWALGNVLALLPALLHKGTFCSSPCPSLWLFPGPPPTPTPSSLHLPPHAAPLGCEE